MRVGRRTLDLASNCQVARRMRTIDSRRVSTADSNYDLVETYRQPKSCTQRPNPGRGGQHHRPRHRPGACTGSQSNYWTFEIAVNATIVDLARPVLLRDS